MDDELALRNQLCFALYATSHAMTRAYAPMLDRLGLTYPQYVVLLALWETDGLSVNEIAARLALDAGTVTPLLRRMERAQLLTRNRSAADERRVEVRLAGKGKRLRASVAKVRLGVLEKTGLSLDSGVDLRARLQRLFESLTAADAPVPSAQSRQKRSRKQKEQ